MTSIVVSTSSRVQSHTSETHKNQSFRLKSHLCVKCVKTDVQHVHYLIINENNAWRLVRNQFT